MRYSVISKGLTIDQLEAEVKKVGAKDITRTKLMGQIFCEMDDAQAATLSKMAGMTV